MKMLGNLFWVVIGVLGATFLASLMYRALTDTGRVNVREESVLATPVCKKTPGGAVTFKAIEGSEPAREPIFVRDDHTIMYDPKIAGWPYEAREFALTAACARISVADADEADCVAVKRLRDELDFKKEKVAVITQHLADSQVRRTRMPACGILMRASRLAEYSRLRAAAWSMRVSAGLSASSDQAFISVKVPCFAGLSFHMV